MTRFFFIYFTITGAKKLFVIVGTSFYRGSVHYIEVPLHLNN